jgi:hypothetical protein
MLPIIFVSHVVGNCAGGSKPALNCVDVLMDLSRREGRKAEKCI